MPGKKSDRLRLIDGVIFESESTIELLESSEAASANNGNFGLANAVPLVGCTVVAVVVVGSASLL